MAYDFGIKTNILRRLASFGCSITVVPAATPADDVLAMNPDGIFFSNGPVCLNTTPWGCSPPLRGRDCLEQLHERQGRREREASWMAGSCGGWLFCSSRISLIEAPEAFRGGYIIRELTGACYWAAG